MMRTMFLLVALSMSACAGQGTAVECEQDTNCNLSGGGVCRAADTGSMWCSYPDPACPSGYRYSDQSVGDDLAGVCVPGDAPLTAKLQVSVNGPGSVTSEPAGLSCSSGTCSAVFPVGTRVRLLATANSLAFLGWSGACRGVSECSVVLNADASTEALFGNPGTALWVTQFGGSGTDKGQVIARDSQDNLIVAGVFSNSVMFGSTMLTSAGAVDIYVAKLAQATGAVIWAKRFGGASEDLVRGLAVNEQDEIFVSGSFVGNSDFGGGPMTNAGARDIFLLKLTAAGDFAWAKPFGTAGFDQGTAVAARNGKVALGAYFVNNSLTVGTATLTNQGGEDIAVALFSTAGDLQWAKSFGGTSDDEPATVGIDSTGNVIAAGFFQFTANLGMGSVTSAGNKDAFLIKLGASDGASLVAKRFGGDDLDTADAVAIDTTDAMYLAGSFRHTVNFGTGNITASSANNSDAYLLKVSVAGATVWSKGYGGAGNGRKATSVAITPNNDVVFAGGFNGELSLGGATLSSASGADDVFLARAASADGSYVSSVRAGGQGQESANSVAQTTDGKFFVTGGFQGFADFGGMPLTAVGLDDAFVFAMAPI